MHSYSMDLGGRTLTIEAGKIHAVTMHNLMPPLNFHIFVYLLIIRHL